jgi:hypothetical protein
VKLGSLCGGEIQARKNWAHMFWAVFQWKLLQSDEAKEASMKGEVITGGLDRAVNKAAKAGPCAPSSSLWRCRNALHACTTARPIRSSITAASSIPSRHPPVYSTSKHKTLLSFFSYQSAF